MSESNIRKLDFTNKIDRMIAGYMFGESNLKNNSKEMLASNPLVLLCKDTEQESSFTGIDVKGFDFGFCNNTQTVQTDVGKCIGGYPDQVLINGKIHLQEKTNKIGAGLKDVEHIMIIQTDKFGTINEQSYKVLVKVNY